MCEECDEVNLSKKHGNRRYCDDCASERKKEKDRVAKAEKGSKDDQLLKKIVDYAKEKQPTFDKFDDKFIIKNIAFKFGMNPENLEHMDLIRKALSEAGVEAGYNIK